MPTGPFLLALLATFVIDTSLAPDTAWQIEEANPSLHNMHPWAARINCSDDWPYEHHWNIHDKILYK